MVVDIVASYDDTYKKTLRNLRKRLVLGLAENEDPKKIVSFLNKCCVIGIDEDKQVVYVGVPNDFVLQQVKKFFSKQLVSLTKILYNTHYSTEYVVYPDLQQHKHDLQIDLKTILPNSPSKESTSSTLKSLDKKVTKSLTNYFGILFQKNFRFENFVVGSSNQFAHSVADAVSQNPGTAYNPFFMYGGVGLGKTHLMQALGNAIIEKYPEKVVVYLPTSKFIDHIIGAIRKNQLGRLIEKLEEVDVLMLDDIQFLAGKEKTQEIFHNIFNDFTAKHKQIVVTSDQPPAKLTLLESRLQSRFSLGVVADIKSPDFETRVAILETKLKNKGETLDDEIIQSIAERVTSNVRELEGALNIILTKKQLLKKEITETELNEALETLGISHNQTHSQTTTPLQTPETTPSNGTPHISQSQSLDQIIETACEFYGVTKDDVLSAKRKKEISFVRQLLMYVAKKKYHRSLQKIGNYFGGRNHASVIYAIKTFEEHLSSDKQTQSLVQQKFLT